jgi:hypothetical protein
VTGQPVDDGDHLIVDAKRVRETKQGVAWRFDPHDETPGGVNGILEQETREKKLDFLHIQIVSIAESSINIKTQSFYE